MSEIVIERLARRLLKCPFDQELFDSAKSALSLRVHLCEAHGAEICRSHRIVRRQASDPADRPRRLYCCLDCDFAVPEGGDGNPQTGMYNHIRAEHPNPRGPVQFRFRTTEDETVIDNFVNELESFEVSICARCDQIFADDATVAEHWIEKHYEEVVTVEEANKALESDPERFGSTLIECLAQVAEEEVLQRLTIREPDDGYEIRHSPSVPRVRSAPSESIVYIKGEAVTLLDREVEELFRYEGLDLGDEVSMGQTQAVPVELRFCNIKDGYIPLVKNIRSILPPLLADGEIVEFCWHARTGVLVPMQGEQIQARYLQY